MSRKAIITSADIAEKVNLSYEALKHFGYVFRADCRDEATEAFLAVYAEGHDPLSARAKAEAAVVEVFERYSKQGMPWFPWELKNLPSD